MHFAQEATTGLFFLAPWLVFAPLIGLLINLVFGRWFSETLVGTVASLASGAAFVISVLLTLSLSANHGELVRWRLAEWIHIGALQLDWTFRVDSLSTTMMLVVSGVGTLIHIYAIGYMHEDVRFKNDVGRFRRFFIYLNLFIAMMMILVSGDSYMMLFVGWEGVGLCSFLLIGFWYELDTLGRPSWANSNAAKKAFIVNRVGDFGFLIAGFIMFWAFGSFQFDEVFEAAADAAPGVIMAITLLMLVGVAGKSAQIPLYVWLPDAMAGPTPVSALIHAATMVTAGVYMVARLNFLFAMSPAAMTVVAVVGCLTALFAASIGFFQYDIKKVLAYSTVSQLGFMFVGVGVGAYWAGVFHLMTHAFFKACLFLGSGSVILACHHEQDMRKMGGLREYTPITRWTYFAACLAIAGFPVASGFYSKDEILWKAFTARGLVAPWIGPAIYVVGTIAALGTSFYMFRSYFMTFTGSYRGGAGHEDKERLEDPHAMAAHAHAGAADAAPTHAAAVAQVHATSVPHQHDASHGAAAHDDHGAAA